MTFAQALFAVGIGLVGWGVTSMVKAALVHPVEKALKNSVSKNRELARLKGVVAKLSLRDKKPILDELESALETDDPKAVAMALYKAEMDAKALLGDKT